MKVARTVLNGESGSNAADLHNDRLNYDKKHDGYQVAKKIGSEDANCGRTNQTCTIA